MMGPRATRTRMYGPSFLGAPSPAEPPMAFGDNLMQPDMSQDYYGNNLMRPDLGGGVQGLGEAMAKKHPVFGQVTGRERAGAFLLGQVGKGDLGQMLLDRRQRQLEDAYRNEMQAYRGGQMGLVR